MKWYDRWKLITALALAAALLAAASPVQAATNTASGDIAGVVADLGNSNTFTLNAQALALIKRAFLTDGTPLTSGATLPRGTAVRFMIYVNNNTAFAVNDMSVQDVLAANFVYQAGTIKVDNSVNNCAAVACTPAEEAAIYAAVNAAAARTDAIDPDVASYTGGSTTIDVGNQAVANAQLNVSANKVWAVVFTVVMQ